MKWMNEMNEWTKQMSELNDWMTEWNEWSEWMNESINASSFQPLPQPPYHPKGGRIGIDVMYCLSVTCESELNYEMSLHLPWNYLVIHRGICKIIFTISLPLQCNAQLMNILIFGKIWILPDCFRQDLNLAEFGKLWFYRIRKILPNPATCFAEIIKFGNCILPN